MPLESARQVFEITLTRGYDEAAFREDLKRLYGLLGTDNKRVVFLFTDAHVADESFLELVNNMLTSGGPQGGAGAAWVLGTTCGRPGHEEGCFWGLVA